MQKSPLFAAAGVAAALMIGTDAMAQQPDTLRPVPPAPAMPAPEGQAATSETVVDALREAGNFNVLLSLIDAAGLGETLAGDGPFTIFAPTDEAFAQIPGPIRAALAANPDQLRDVLLNHVIEGKLSAADVQGTPNATTLGGGTLEITTTDGEVRVENAVVTRPDVMAENGIVHAVSSVLLPSTDAQDAMPRPMPEPTMPPTTIPPTTPPPAR